VSQRAVARRAEQEARSKEIEAARLRARGVLQEQLEPAQERPQPPKGITKVEREELRGILKGRSRLAGKVIEQRAAELLADIEKQLATKYKIDDAAWRDLAAVANGVVEKADAEVAQRCRALGIPEEFRPSLSLFWYDRGGNADKKRRDELRRMAVTRINAMAKQAQVEIQSKALDGQELLARSALESAAAQQFLALMPSVKSLMPALDVSSLGPLALPPSKKDEEDEGDEEWRADEDDE
jgi:hypothetical protein